MMKSLRRNSILSMLILLLCACATSQNYQIALKSWRGANINQLVKVWGYPNKRSKAPSGNTLYIYHIENKGRHPVYRAGGTTVVTKHGSDIRVSTTPSIYSGGGSYDYSCTTWFEVNKKNIIVNTATRGNNCVASKDFLRSHRYQYQ